MRLYKENNNKEIINKEWKEKELKKTFVIGLIKNPYYVWGINRLGINCNNKRLSIK